MNFFTKEIKIALVTILGIVVLFFGMNFLKGLNLFSTSNEYFIEFQDISGLSSSSPIYADGYKVGTVKGIIYDYSNEQPTRVQIDIDKQMRIPEGSTAEIESDMMGNVKVNLLLANNPRQRIEPGGTIKGVASIGIVGQVAGLMPDIEKMLPKLDSIMASLNLILGDPSIRQSLHNIQDITADLTTSTKQLNTLMGTLNANAPKLLAKANGTLDNTERLTGNLASVDIASTMRNVDETLANVKSLTAKLNSNEGSLGLLMNDPSLYNNLTSTMSSADSLLIDLRQHPKRYVHFSLFGKKDK